MNKLLITGCLLATAVAAVAMPTKKELAAAQKLVEDVIAPDVKALNAGLKTVKDVADIQMKLATDAQSEAEKYLLLQSAFKLYSRGEEFDSAAKALTAITRDIKDAPPELITELVDKEFNRDMGLKAPQEIEAAEKNLLQVVKTAQSEFKMDVKPGTVTMLKLADDCEIEFVYCPAGEFTMGYKNMPQVTRCRTIRITHPFWMSKTPITDHQLDALNVSLSRRSPDGYGRVDTVQIPAFITPTALGKKFGGRLPRDYVFRLPTEAEFEYVLKAEATEGDPRLEWAFADKEDSLQHPWGVKGLWRDKMCLFDRYPPSGQDVVHRIARNVTWTDLLKINYDNQPQENPLGWSDDPKWKPLRWPKLGGHGLHGTAFFLVVAPDPALLNKFIWK